MAQSNKAPSSAPISVIGSHFMVPHQLDINHKIIFKVKPCDSVFPEQRVLLDVDDQPIVLMCNKSMTAHNGWYVFRGDSESKSDMIFTTKKHCSDVNVFLANKTSNKNVCDFKVEGSWSKRNCTIYMGDTSTTIAQGI
uniref:Uncharacterized protein n=1 Tax=Lactuca sativa TaxID=4236 RepID=A0A9R1WXU4_LACSA|nr:hypothetical protein LSAT_V11C800433940 [Lactuca sativa]